MDVIRSRGNFDAGAGPREDHPLVGLKSPNELASDGRPARMSAAGVSAGGRCGRLRYGAADAERENEREGLEPLHQTQLTTSTLRGTVRVGLSGTVDCAGSSGD